MNLVKAALKLPRNSEILGIKPTDRIKIDIMYYTEDITFIAVIMHSFRIDKPEKRYKYG
jgi:hypothetical protein